MTPVVNKPTIGTLLDGRPCSDRSQPSGKRRTATSRVDDQIGTHIFASIGAHANDMWDARRGRIAGQQADDSDTASDREVVSLRRDSRDRCFRDRPTCRHCIMPLVSLAEPTRDACGRVTKRIHQQCACFQERRDDVGCVGVHHLPIARLEEVQQAELIDPPSFPALPSCRGIRRGRRIPLEYRDRMAITSQHQRRTQPDDPSANHNDPSHSDGLVHSCDEQEDPEPNFERGPPRPATRQHRHALLMQFFRAVGLHVTA